MTAAHLYTAAMARKLPAGAVIPAPFPDEVNEQVQDGAPAAFAAAGVARIDSFVDEETGDTWLMQIHTVTGPRASRLRFSSKSGMRAGPRGGKTRG